MNKITTVCTDALTAVTSYACGGLKGNRIYSLILAKPTASLTVSGDVPTVSELQTGLAATGDDKLVVLKHISNGLVDEIGSSELSDLDTESGLPEKFNVQMAMTGNIKHPTQDVYERTMEYNQYPILYVWAIDNKGYIWGGKTGYKCSAMNAFSPRKMDGVTQHVSFSLAYIADEIADDTAQDDDYLTLDNS